MTPRAVMSPKPFKVVGERVDQDTVNVRREAGKPLGLHLKQCNHSESFEWSYGGSGPAQLAFCILYEYYLHCGKDASTAQELAWKHHHNFKWQYISLLDHGRSWVVTSDLIDGMGFGA